MLAIITKTGPERNDCFNPLFVSVGQDDIETDLEDEEGPNTIQEAIKQEAKKHYGPGSANQDQLYRFSDKDFMLPGKVYGCTFNKHTQDCYQIPDGFVTPLRATPHRFVDWTDWTDWTD